MSPRTFVARSAAILSLAALGLAACESKTVVQPQTFPLTIAVSPASVTLTTAGQKAQFVAVVSGGTTDQAKTYTWASSNTAVATVDANGVVTAVANGVASITATSTADANVKAAGLVTVQLSSGPAVVPPTISIQEVTNNAGQNVPLDNVSGQINVALNVDVPPGNNVSKVEVLVDGNTACSQSFTQGTSAQVGVEAATAVTIVCSINTAKLNGATPQYANGTHTISARLVNASGSVVASTSQTFTFNNQSVLNLTVSASKTGTSPQGLVWNGGTITVVATPALFTGTTVALNTITVRVGTTSKTVTVSGTGAQTVTFTPADLGSPDGQQTLVNVTATSITTAGQGGPTSGEALVNPTPVLQINLDEKAPTIAATTFSGITNGYLNASSAFTRASLLNDTTVTDNGGSNTNTVTFQVAGSDTTAVGWTTATTVAALGNAVPGSFQTRMVVCDQLGNCRTLGPSPTFGVDLLAPVVATATGSVKTNAKFTAGCGTGTVGTDLLLSARDTGVTGSTVASGLTGNFVTYTVKQFPATGSPDSTNSYKALTGSSTTLHIPTNQAYDSLYAWVTDAAGNKTALAGLLVSVDCTAPVVGNISTPSIITPGTNPTFSDAVTDNLDLGTYTMTDAFTSLGTFQIIAGTLGTFGLPREQSGTVSATPNPFIGALQGTTAGVPNATVETAQTVGLNVKDAAGNSTDATAVSITTAMTAGGFTGFQFDTATTVANRVQSFVVAAGDEACVTDGCTAKPTTQTLTAVVTLGLNAPNPFTNVIFYANVGGVYQQIGVASAATASVSQNTTVRTYTYSITWTPSSLFSAAGTPTVAAIGVNSKGAGLITTATVTLQ